MSGKKRALISISEEEYHRLIEAERNLRFKKNDNKKIAKQISEETRNDLSRYFRDLEDRQANFINSMGFLNDDILKIEETTNERMRLQKLENIKMMDQFAGQLWDSAISRIEDQQKFLIDEFFDLQQQKNNEISDLFLHLDDNYHANRKKEKIAAEWVNASSSLFDYLSQNFSFIPWIQELIPSLEERLVLSIQNYQEGVPESALSVAQTLYLELSNLRVESEQYIQEVEFQFQRVHEYIRKLQYDIHKNATCNAIDLKGNELDLISVDYWTKGEIQRIENQINILSDELEDQSMTLDTDDLNYLMKSILPKIDADIQNAVHKARIAVLNSQLRINIADLALQAIKVHGFEIVSSVYIRDDMNNGYHAKARNRNGNEITILVNPQGENVGQNELMLDLESVQQLAEREYLMQASTIIKALKDHGLKTDGLSKISSSEFFRSFKNTPPKETPDKEKYQHSEIENPYSG